MKSRRLILFILILSILLPGLVQAGETFDRARLQLNQPDTNEVVVERLSGKNRIETAIYISQAAYPNGSRTVVLAGYYGEVDALTGTLLASTKDAPLLFTRPDELPDNLVDEIKRLNPTSIYILGGERVVSSSIEYLLEKDYQVERIDGANRAMTAVKIAKEVQDTSPHIFLAKGYDQYVDALAIGPVSAKKSMPVLLTKTDSLPKDTLEALVDLGVTHITLIGGEAAISPSLEKDLGKDYKVSRIAGKSRIETALSIAEEYFTDSENLLVVYGRKYADGLVGGYLGAKKNAPILLTNKDQLPASTEKYIKSNPAKIFILGGESVVGKSVFDDLKDILADSLAEEPKEPEDEIPDGGGGGGGTPQPSIKEELVIDEDNTSITLEDTYRTIKINGDNITLDLNNKNIDKLVIGGNNATVKNGNIKSIEISQYVEDIDIDNVKDISGGTHIFAGGGGNSIRLRGSTELRNKIKIISNTPLRLTSKEEDGSQSDAKLIGDIIVNTGEELIIETPVEGRLQVETENESIKIKSPVKEIHVLAKAKVEVAEELIEIEDITLKKAEGVDAKLVDDKGEEKESFKFEEDKKLEKRDIEAQAISISPKTISLMEQYQARLIGEILPSNTTNKKIKWTSEDESIATVDSNGIVKAISIGTTTIKAVSDSNKELKAVTTIEVVALSKDKAKYVEKLIDKLPQIEVIGLDNLEGIREARSLYQDLPQEEKDLVSQSKLEKLIAAENKIEELQEAAAYAELKLEIEAKVVAYQLLVEGDLRTQELIDAANEAKSVISFDGLKETDKTAFQIRIDEADALVAVAQKILDEEKAVNEAVENFRNLVSDALSLEVESVKVGDKDAVVGALEVYAKLSDEVQGRLKSEKGLLDELLSEIEKQEAINLEAADFVTNLINDLPEIEALTLGSQEVVNSVRTAYEDLTTTQKGLISSSDLAKLVAAEEKILVLLVDKEASDKADQFKETHKDALALGVDNVSINDKEIVVAALGAYAELHPEVQAKLAEGEKDLLDSLKLKILELEQEAAEDQAAAENVDKLINALPSVDNLVLADKKDVGAARTAYDDLNDIRKALVTKLGLLTAIEAQIAELEKTVDLVGDRITDGNYVVNRNYTDNSIKSDSIGTVALWIGDKEVTDDFDISFYASKNGNKITSFDLSNGGTSFKAYMVAKAKDGRDYYDVETGVFFKYGSVTIGNNDSYYTIEDALAKADSGTIFVKYNTSFADKEVAEEIYSGTEFTVKKGVTVLLPYSSELSEKIDDTPSAASGPITRNKAYVELKVPSQIGLNIKGILNVNSMRATHGTRISGHVTTTNYSQLYLANDSKVTVENGGTLSAMGFVYGEGQVEALSGSTVNDNLFNQGFRGGSATLNIQSSVFPFDQFTINNIETQLVINSGANYIAKNLIYVSSKYNKGDLKLAGSDSKSLIQLTSGQLIKTYDVDTGVVTLDFHGDASINESSIMVAGITANSNGKDMPFDGTWKFSFASGSNVSIDSWMVLLPGGQMEIEEGANVTITKNGRLGVFDPYEHLDDYNTYPVTKGSTSTANKDVEEYYRHAPTFAYSANTPARLNINGSLTVEGGLAGRVHKSSNTSLIWGSGSYRVYEYNYVVGSAGNAESNSREISYWEEGESTLSIVATPSTVVTKDKTKTTIVATVKDGDNKPIQGVNLTFTGGKGEWSATSGTTDKNGSVTVTYITSEEEEKGTVLTVTEDQENKSARVNLDVKETAAGCPFIYSYDGEEYHFEAEPVSAAVLRNFEDTDFGTLNNLRLVDGSYHIRIAEDTDTETFVNGFNFYTVDYKDNSGIQSIVADIYGNPHTIKNRLQPKSFIDSSGRDLLYKLTTDGCLVTSSSGPNLDNLVERYELVFDRPRNSVDMAKLMVSVRGTDLVDGFNNWFNDLVDSKNNVWWIEDLLASNSMDKEFSEGVNAVGFVVELWDSEDWIKQTEIAAGTHLLEEFLIPIDLSQIKEDTDEIKVRLVGGTGFFEIGNISIDFSENEEMIVKKLDIHQALRNGLVDVRHIVEDFNNNQRVELQKGDFIDLYYDAVDPEEGFDRGFMVEFKGYFHGVANSKKSPIPGVLDGMTYEEIIGTVLGIQEEAADVLPNLEFLINLANSVANESLEYKIEKIIYDCVIPWMNR